MDNNCEVNDNNLNIEEGNCKKMKMDDSNSEDKKNNAESQFDPFRFGDEEPYEQVLQYLSGKDILNLSLVSKFWYSYTAESPTAQSKIQFVVNESHTRGTLSLKEINDSERCYQNLHIKGIFDGTKNNILAFVGKHAFSLTSITTCYDLKLDGLLLPFLEKLTLFPRYQDTPINLQFQGFCASTDNLEELHIYGKIKMVAAIQKCLQTNTKLKKLTLENGCVEDAFFKGAHSYEFRLEEFRCDATAHDNETFWANYNNFIDFQSDSLRLLKINCGYRQLQRVFSLLPKLRVISYYPIPSTYRAGCMADFNFASHRHLEEVRFIFTPPDIIYRIIRGSPKIHTIYVADLSVEIFKSIVECMPDLVCLKYAFVNESYNIANMHNQFIQYHRQFYPNSKLTIVKI